MDHIVNWINGQWWWMGPGLLILALGFFMAALRDLVRHEVRWWKHVRRKTSNVKRER